MRLRAARFFVLSSLLVLGPVAAAQEAEPPSDPAELRRAAEARFAPHDADRDGKLAGEELPKAWLALHDLDGDGEVSRSEYVEAALRPRKLRFAHPLRDPGARLRLHLRFDADKDGFVSAEEYPGGELVFRRADRDRDGRLDRGELLALAREELEDLRKKMRRPSRREFLSAFDLDGDRNVDLDEYDGATKWFRRYDEDGDGVVTYAELYPELVERTREERPRDDLDVLQAMDRDGDGRVSRAEWRGSEAGWKRLDRNRDGVLSKADAL